MHILFATSEYESLFKLGGLADVSRSLPEALVSRGINVMVTMPFYASVPSEGFKCVGSIAVDFDGVRELVFLFAKPINPSQEGAFGRNSYHCGTLLLFRHPCLDTYRSKHIEETFAFFSKAVATYYLYCGITGREKFDIVHCNDWHTALIPMLIGEDTHNKNVKRGEAHKLPGTLTQDKDGGSDSDRLLEGYAQIARRPKRTIQQTIQSRSAKTILTIHNLLYRGITNIDIANMLMVPASLFHPLSGKTSRKVSFLHEGMVYADHVTTVSPTYAREIEGTGGDTDLRKIMEKRHDHIIGIINGIDTHLWDPASDTYLLKKYDHKTVNTNKAINKSHLQKEVGLSQADAMLCGFIGRIEPRQKGADLLPEMFTKINIQQTGASGYSTARTNARVKQNTSTHLKTHDDQKGAWVTRAEGLPLAGPSANKAGVPSICGHGRTPAAGPLEISFEMSNNQIQIIILGKGDPETVKKLAAFAKKHPRNFVLIDKFDEGLARRIYAACDVLLVPSKFEPCGLTQMIAMRYGTIPVVRKTGGLADTVTDRKTGFTFEKYDVHDFAGSISRAYRMWKEGKKWSSMIRACMRQDFSWDIRAEKYIKLYKINNLPDGGTI
jgi:glycogen synthase